MLSPSALLLQANLSALFLLVLGSTSIDETDCVSQHGPREETEVCTAQNPCRELLSTYTGVSELAEEETFPTYCGNFQLKDEKGTVAVGDNSSRHYCYYVPSSASVTNKVPLVLFMHGSGGNANAYYRYGWRDLAATGTTSAFGGEPFAVVGLAALNRHWPRSVVLGDNEGSKFDYLFKNFSNHPDFLYVDSVIDSMVSTGKINPSMIYVTGNSNGGYFGAMYSIVRSQSRTLGGNVIAAAVSFSSADPFTVPTNCQLKNRPEPARNFRYLLVSYACDLVPCLAAETFVASLDPAMKTNLFLDNDGNETNSSSSLCSSNVQGGSCQSAKKYTNHATYPTQWIPYMLAFMAGTNESASTEVPIPSAETTQSPSPNPESEVSEVLTTTTLGGTGGHKSSSGSGSDEQNAIRCVQFCSAGSARRLFHLSTLVMAVLIL